jgi:hypothetical protein
VSQTGEIHSGSGGSIIGRGAHIHIFVFYFANFFCNQLFSRFVKRIYEYDPPRNYQSFAAAYFDSVDGRTPPKWSDRMALEISIIINLNWRSGSWSSRCNGKGADSCAEHQGSIPIGVQYFLLIFFDL